MIIAVDPGLACGVFAIRSDGSIWDRREERAYECVSNIDRWFALGKLPKVIVCERYTITQAHMSQQPDALEVIGALRYIARKWNVRFELQGRAERVRVTNDMLRAIGWWTTSPGGHVNEAARHCALALIKLDPDHDLVQRLLGTI